MPSTVVVPADVVSEGLTVVAVVEAAVVVADDVEHADPSRTAQISKTIIAMVLKDVFFI